MHDTSNASNASDEGWQVVSRTKKTSVPTASGGYIPPHLRNKGSIQNIAPKTVNVDSMDDFPSFGMKTMTAQNGSPWGSKTSFSQKVHDLIAFEQRTEAEKMEEIEITKELEGYAVLSLKFDKERYVAFNDKMAAAEMDVERLVDMYTRQMNTYTCQANEIKDDDTVSVAYSTDYDE